MGKQERDVGLLNVKCHYISGLIVECLAINVSPSEENRIFETLFS